MAAQFVGLDSTFDQQRQVINQISTDFYQLSDGVNNFFAGNANINATGLQVIGNSYISGNLGIGTSNPQQKLHINGSVFATTGFISFGSTTPVTINVVGNKLIFNVAGIGSTSFNLV